MTSELQELLDRQAIRATLFRHCVNFDTGRIEDMDKVFAPDCRTDYGPERGGILVGRDAFLDRIRGSLTQFNWTHHHLGESIIDLRGDEASAMTYVLGWHELTSGERCWVGARYEDELRRQDDGQWLIVLRKTVVTSADGSMADQNWLRLERQVPTA